LFTESHHSGLAGGQAHRSRQFQTEMFVLSKSWKGRGRGLECVGRAASLKRAMAPSSGGSFSVSEAESVWRYRRVSRYPRTSERLEKHRRRGTQSSRVVGIQRAGHRARTV